MHKNSLSSLAFFLHILYCVQNPWLTRAAREEIGAELQKMRDYICYHHGEKEIVKGRSYWMWWWWWRASKSQLFFLCGQWNQAALLRCSSCSACGNGVDDGANWQWQGSREKRTFITISSTLRYYGVRGQSILAQPALPLVNDFLGPPKGSRSTGKHWSFKTMNVVFLPLVVEEESWDLFFQSHHSSNSGYFLSQKF